VNPILSVRGKGPHPGGAQDGRTPPPVDYVHSLAQSARLGWGLPQAPAQDEVHPSPCEARGWGSGASLGGVQSSAALHKGGCGLCPPAVDIVHSPSFARLHYVRGGVALAKQASPL
jgi:hypothetical protein